MMRRISSLALIATAALPGAARAEAVFFNHAYVNVAPATFEAIRASLFVKDEFGSAESRTVVADGGKAGWSGYYLYGERTYLEFFPAGSGDPLGKIGIGLSIDDRQQLPRLAKRLSASTGVPVPIGKQTRTLQGAEVDWFDAIGPDYGESSNPMLETWVMALYPTYLRKRYPDLTAQEDGVERGRNLARQYLPGRLLRNVTGISLVLAVAERGRLLKVLGGAGFTITRRGKSDEAAGGEFRFILSTASARHPRSITYHLALNRSAEAQTLKIGASTLAIQPGAAATWHFPAEGDAAK